MNIQTITLADPKAARLIGSLALMYLRHADAPRALALGIAAMKMAPVTPGLALTVAAAFLRTDEPAQALAVLSRFDPGRAALDPAPDDGARAAALVLRAKAHHRLRRPDAASADLAQACALRRGLP